MADWETVKLPRDMVQKLNEFVETKYAKNSGFTSKSQIIVFGVREFLRNYSNYKTYLDYLGFEKKTVKIMDHELGKIIDVKLDSQYNTLFCKNHNSDNCNHIRFVWTLPRFKEELKNFQKPTNSPKIKNFTVQDIKKELGEDLKRYRKQPKKNKITNQSIVKILQEMINDLEK